MKTNKTVIQNVCECLKELGLPSVDPFLADPEYAVATAFTSHGVEFVFQIHHKSKSNMLFFEIWFPAKLPRDRKSGIYEVMNEFNSKSVLGHFAICEFKNKMTFRSGYFLLEVNFNIRKFKEIFQRMIIYARENYPLLHKLISEEVVKT